MYRGGVELTSEFWKRTWLEIWPRRQGNRVRKKMEGRRHALTRHRFVALMSFPFRISPQRSPISNENCGNEVRVLRAFTPTLRVGLDKRQDRHEFRTKIVTSFVIGEKEKSVGQRLPYPGFASTEFYQISDIRSYKIFFLFLSISSTRSFVPQLFRNFINHLGIEEEA